MDGAARFAGIIVLLRGLGLIIVVVGWIAGCGRFGFDTISGGGDDAPPPDAPVPVTPIGKALSIGIGSGGACAVLADRSLWCWGDRRPGTIPSGALASSPDAAFYHPSRVGGDADWAEVALGERHGCALKMDGTLWCWGTNDVGQVGVEMPGLVDAPTQVTGTWQHVAAGNFTTCAITASGGLGCWGSNSDGQFGNNTTTDSPIPVMNPALANVTQVSIGVQHVCAREGEVLSCWGLNNDGELGDNGTTPSLVPLQVPGSWRQVSAGFFGTAAIASDGSLWRFGHGVGRMRQQVGTRTDWVEVSRPYVGTCAIDGEGALWCNAGNVHGDLGLGTPGRTSQMTQVEPGRRFSAITHSTTWNVYAQEYNGCANRDDELVCAGTGWRGQLGDGNAARWSRAPRRVSAETWDEAHVTNRATCMRGASGGVECLGKDLTSQRPLSAVPTPLAGGPLSEFSADDLSCGLEEPGGIWTWGWIPTSNTDGMWGVAARLVTTPLPVRSVSCANGRGAYVLSDGTMWAWGRNTTGQLGDGTTTFRAAPVQIATGVDRVDVGATHACAIRETGAISCWGANSRGELGDGSFTDRTTPPELGSAAVWTAVSATTYQGGHTCGIQDDRSLWCWGSDATGQLGDGSPGGSTPTPARVGEEEWVDVDTAWEATCAVREDGSLWCWGSNRGGRITGSYVAGADGPSLSVPTRIGTASDWASVSIAITHACARKTNGEVWCWGSNDEGQLGAQSWSADFLPVARPDP